MKLLKLTNKAIFSIKREEDYNDFNPLFTQYANRRYAWGITGIWPRFCEHDTQIAEILSPSPF